MTEPEKEPEGPTATSSPTVSIQRQDPGEDAKTSKEQISKEQMPGAEPIEYPQGVKLALITLALCLSVFIMALDNTIIATAIPKITDHFGSLDDVGWYGSAYLLTIAGLQLLYGKFYTFFSIKWTFMAAISIFEIGSLICGAATTSDALIIGRAVAGIGAAGMFSGSLTIIAHTVDLSKRAIYSGILGAMYGLSSVTAPLLGGALTDKVSWRWCFYINLPVGAVTLVVIALSFHPPPKPKQITGWLKKFDVWGTLVFIPAVVCLLLALQFGGTKYPWSSAKIIALLVMFGILIIAFVAIQIWKQDDATVPPRIFLQRSILASSLFAFCLGASFLVLMYFISIWFQAIKGTSAVRSGINSLPMILSLVVGSLISGALTSATGYYAPWMIISSVMASVGAGMVSTFEPGTSTPEWIGYQIIYGFGMGSGMQQGLMAAQTVLPLEDVPSGTSIIAFMQTISGAIFISIAQNVFSNKLASGIAEHVPGLNPEVILGAGATSLKYVVPERLMESVIHVYNDALVSTYYVSIAMSCLSLVGALSVEWKNMKKSGNGPATMHAA